MDYLAVGCAVLPWCSGGANLDKTFSGYPFNKITRVLDSEWIARRTAEGKRSSTVLHQYFVLKQVLDRPFPTVCFMPIPVRTSPCSPELTAVASTTSSVDGVVDRAQFLTAGQISHCLTPCSGHTT
ncbi:hypothetical protein CH286_16630 [Rhodococcus sp. WWJCD1]|nr:hypothetical protein CH286_16630 [Rhodococcus sp. WWJCD1]